MMADVYRRSEYGEHRQVGFVRGTTVYRGPDLPLGRTKAGFVGDSRRRVAAAALLLLLDEDQTPRRTAIGNRALPLAPSAVGTY